MSIAELSLAGLFLAIIVSCFTRLNIGVFSIVLAWIIGVYFGGMKLDTVIAGFPLCANMTETSRVTAINEQGGKENQHGNDKRFCSVRYRCGGSI